mmetsp:Transcript_69710/g.213759  ORF Transcript_69710/g.213759 Transcript_69710/m.213759 type:complete len:219 (-) Transcript_69710:288-944(-)
MTRDTCATSSPRPIRSVAMSCRALPTRKSSMIPSRSFCGMSPCMDAIGKFAARMRWASQSTFFLLLQKITACVTVTVSYRSHSVSSFHFSCSTAMKNCWIVAAATAERFTRRRNGLFMKSAVISTTSSGIVADTNTTWSLLGRWRWIAYTCSLKPLVNISSASSNTNILTRTGDRCFCWIAARTLPGVPETMCTPALKALTASFMAFPPTQLYKRSPA